MRKRKDFVILKVCFLLFIFSFVNANGDEDDSESETSPHDEGLFADGDVILGGLFPVHLERTDGRCVNLQYDAVVWTEAMILSIEEINRNPNLLPNITLGYRIFDSCGNVRTAMEWSADFVFDNTLRFDPKFRISNECESSINKPKSSLNSIQLAEKDFPPAIAVVGGDLSTVSINLANMLQLVDISQISYGSTSTALSNKSAYESFFRTVPPDNLQSRAMVDVIAHNHWKCVAVIGVDDPYGRSGVDSFVQEAAKQNICIAFQELFSANEPENRIKDIISQLKQKPQIEIYILYCLAPHAVKVLREALRQNITTKTWIASDGWAESNYLEAANYLPVIGGSLGFVVKNVRLNGLEAHLQGLNSSIRNTVWWEELWQHQYNCDVSAESQTKNITQRCHGNETLSKRIYGNYLLTRKAAYVRDAVYGIANALDSVLRCSSHNASCVKRLSELRPRDVLLALRNTSFLGLTGFLDFRTDRRVTASYDIVNFVQGNDGKIKFVTVGTWTEKNQPNLELNDSKILWKRDSKPRGACGEVCGPGTWQSLKIPCLWDCLPCIGDKASFSYGSLSCTACRKGYIANANHTQCVEVPLVYLRFDEGWGIAITVMTCLCVISTVLVIIATVKYRNTPVIKDTGGYLNILLLVQILFSYVFNFMQISKPSHLTCHFMPIYFYLIYTSASVTLLLKILQIWKLMARPNTNQRKLALIRSWRLYAFGAAIVSIPLLLTIIWVTTTPPKLDKYYASRTRIFGTCVNSTAGSVLRIICVSYLTVLCLVTTVAAYKIKSMPHFQKFHEAKHLAYALTVYTLTFCTFYPGWYLINGPILYVFSSMTNMVAATGTITCAFGPKMVVIFWRTDLNEKLHIYPSPRVHSRRARSGAVGELYFSGTATPSPVRSRAQSALAGNCSNTSSPEQVKRKRVRISRDVDKMADSQL